MPTPFATSRPPGEILALFEKAAALEPGEFHIQLALANEYMRQSRLDKAEAVYDALLARDADCSAALFGKGQIARKNGRGVDALAYFEMAAKCPSPADSAIVELSREWVDAGRIDDARKLLSDRIAQQPRNWWMRMHLAGLARMTGDYATAAAAYGEIAAENPQFFPARIELAAEELRQGRLERARSLLEAILGENPRHVGAIEALANIAEQLDDVNEALALLKTAVDAEPDNLRRRLKYARLLAKAGEVRQARELLEQLRRVYGPEPAIAATQAEIHKQLGDYLEAQQTLDEASARFPRDFGLWRQRVAMLIFRGAFADAAEALGQAAGFRQSGASAP